MTHLLTTLGLVFGVLTTPVVSRAVVPVTTPQTVTLAWDANTDPITGYRTHYGTTEGTFTTHTDVGNVTQWTTPTLPPATYFFIVTAVNGAADSGPSNEVSTIVAQPPPDPCAAPLGANVIAIFITKLEATTGSVGSQARLNFQIGTTTIPPVTSLTVKVNNQVLDPPIVGANLNKTGGIWFTTPSVAGTYPVTLTAANGICTTIATKNALGDLLQVAVK